jgi:hypothetical protein
MIHFSLLVATLARVFTAENQFRARRPCNEVIKAPSPADYSYDLIVWA